MLAFCRREITKIFDLKSIIFKDFKTLHNLDFRNISNVTKNCQKLKMVKQKS